MFIVYAIASGQGSVITNLRFEVWEPCKLWYKSNNRIYTISTLVVWEPCKLWYKSNIFSPSLVSTPVWEPCKLWYKSNTTGYE